MRVIATRRLWARPAGLVLGASGSVSPWPEETASEHETLEGYEGRFEHFEDGWTVGFESYTQDADLSPLFEGLLDDQCQCEHMGYVIKGKVAFRSGDGEEVFEGGDAYYVGPGHTPIL